MNFDKEQWIALVIVITGLTAIYAIGGTLLLSLFANRHEEDE